MTINPSLITKDIDRVIRTLPGVESVTSAALFSAGDLDQHPGTDPESIAKNEAVQVLGSSDGRYTDMDRPRSPRAGSRPVATRRWSMSSTPTKRTFTSVMCSGSGS